MPTKINDEQKQRILNLYAQGLSYREIAEEVGISTSTVHAVVAEGCKKHLDLESIRNLFQEFRKNGHGPIHVEHVIAAEERLDKLNIKPDQISKALDFLEQTGFGEHTMAAIQCGIKLQQLEKKSSLTGQQFLDWYYTNEPKRVAIETQMKNTRAKYENLEAELPNMNELINMKNTLVAKGVTIEKLQIFLDTSLTLEKHGFTKESAIILAEELSKAGMTPENAARRIANQLTKSKSLESAISSKEYNLQQLSQEELHLNQNVATLNKENEKIKKELAGFEESKRKGLSDFKKELDEFENDKLKGVDDKLAQKDKVINEKTAKLEELTKRYYELISKTDVFKDRIILGEALEQILRDPKSTTYDQLRRIREACGKAIDAREAGLLTETSASEEARKIMAPIVCEFVKTDVVTKTAYALQSLVIIKLENELNAVISARNADLLTIPRLFRDDKESKAEIDAEKKRLQGAVGLEVFNGMITNYNDTSKQILENIRDVIVQAINDKSGYSSFSRVSIKPETWQYYFNNKNRPPDKPNTTNKNLRLISKPPDGPKNDKDKQDAA